MMPYVITTNRELEHYNFGAMTRRTGNGEIFTEDVLMINPSDAAQHGIAEGDMVCAESLPTGQAGAPGKVDIKVLITTEACVERSRNMKPGILSSTVHFPEMMLNMTTSRVSDSLAMCPEYKVVRCRIRKARKTHLREAAEVIAKAWPEPMMRSFMFVVVVALTIECNSQTGGPQTPIATYERIAVGRAWAFVNEKGDTIIPPGRYDFLNPIDEEGMILAHRGDRQGYIDIHERVLIPFDYEDVGVFSEGLAPAKKGGIYGMVDRSGKEVVPFKYDELRYLYSCGLAKARIGSRWGFIDGTGAERIPLTYDEVDYNKVDPFVAARRGGKWAFFDGRGNQLTAHKYDELFESMGADDEYSFCTGGLAKVRVGNQFGYIDGAFQEVIPLGAYDNVGAFNTDSLAIVAKDGKAGVLHVKGQMVVPLLYDEIIHPIRYSHVSGNFIAKVGTSFQLLDSKGKGLLDLGLLAVEMDYSRKEDHFIVRSRSRTVGVMGPTGDTLIAFVNDSILPFDGRTVAIAQRRGMWGVVSINDRIIIPFENTRIRTGRFFQYYVVERNGRAGVSDGDGVVLLPFEYEALDPCYYDADNRYIAKRGGSFGLIDLQGKVIIPFEYDSISNWVEYGPPEHLCSRGALFALVARDGNIVVQDLTSEQLEEFLSKR